MRIVRSATDMVIAGGPAPIIASSESSSAEEAPLTPIAPTVLPSTTIGTGVRVARTGGVRVRSDVLVDRLLAHASCATPSDS